MADVGGLEKLLNSEVDEAALKRISGNLQSELISPDRNTSTDNRFSPLCTDYFYQNGPAVSSTVSASWKPSSNVDAGISHSGVGPGKGVTASGVTPGLSVPLSSGAVQPAPQQPQISAPVFRIVSGSTTASSICPQVMNRSRCDSPSVSGAGALPGPTAQISVSGVGGGGGGGGSGGVHEVNVLNSSFVRTSALLSSSLASGSSRLSAVITTAGLMQQQSQQIPAVTIAVCGVDIRQRPPIVQNSIATGQPTNIAGSLSAQAALPSRHTATILRTNTGQLLLVTAPTGNAGVSFGQNLTVPVQVAHGSQPQPQQQQQQSHPALLPSDPGQPLVVNTRLPAHKHNVNLPLLPQNASAPTTSLARMQTAVLTGNVAPGPTTFVSSSSAASPAATQSGGALRPQRALTHDAAEKKCISFLRTLIRLAKDKGDMNVINEVNKLVRGLLLNLISPPVFTEKITAVLNSKPQSNLLPFLETTLPSVQRDFAAGKFVIEGLNVNATPMPVVPPPAPAPAPPLASSLSASSVRTAQVTPISWTSMSNSTFTTTPSNVITNSVVAAAPNVGVCSGSGGAASGISGPYIVATHVGLRSVISNVPPQNLQVHHQYPSVAQHLNTTSTSFRPGALSAPVQTTQVPPQVTAVSASSSSSASFNPQQLSSSSSAAPPSSTVTNSVVITAATSHDNIGAATSRSTVEGAAASTGHNSAPAALAGTSTADVQAVGSSLERYREPEDDINDVAAMGGINLAEESQKILASTAELLSTETRSCRQEEEFLNIPATQAYVKNLCRKRGLDDAKPEVAVFLSRVLHDWMKELLEHLVVLAQHRSDNLRNNFYYEQVSDIRSQLRFIEELDSQEQKRREEREKEIVIKMAKSRSTKIADAEQQRIKERAKELQKAEQEELRNRDANAAAQLALSSSRKRAFSAISSGDNVGVGSSQLLTGTVSASPGSRPPAAQIFQSSLAPGLADGNLRTTQVAFRPRLTRINLRDLQLLLSHHRTFRRSATLYRSYFK